MVSTISDNQLVVSKYASRESTCDSINLLSNDAHLHHGHSVGIAHTRWATHGGKTDANAHPHTDNKKRVAVVHNGTINNSYELKKELTAAGVQFASETDTEVIAQLIGLYLDQGLSSKDAVVKALQRSDYSFQSFCGALLTMSQPRCRCEGSWGLAVLNRANPDEIVVAANGSPMVNPAFLLAVRI